ncbi:MAG: hypothetical protein WCY93_06015 [Anaerolineaceae bacterium]
MEKMVWKKYENNPLPDLGAEPGTWRESASMTVDVLDRGDFWQIFYVGKKDGHDSIGIATAQKSGFDGINWKDNPNNPILSPGEPGSFDSLHLVDPASVVLNGKIYLYYSALGDGPDSLALAISDDGINFQKQAEPVLIGRAPEVVKHNGLIYLFYSMDGDKGGYEFHLATSSDGINFKEEGVVFSPSDSGWDSLSVVTPRIFCENDIFLMAYAGDDNEKDYPTNFGFAFSKDLRNWKRYSHNPVYSGGGPDSWESRAIWFPEILKVDNKYFMWYEGHHNKVSQVGLAFSESPIGQIAIEELNN